MATRIAISKPRIGTTDTRRVKPPPKQADKHYQTPEHRAWALDVKRRAGWRCQAPGCTVAHPARLFADHIVEIKDGGDPLGAGQCLCAEHHALKTSAHRAIRSRSMPD